MDIGWLSAALGAIVGLILALTGAGGGVLAVPLLVFGLQLTVQQAAPVALVAVGASAALGAVLGLRDGVVRYRAAGLIGGVALLVAPGGVWLAHQLPARPLMIGFAGVLAWTAWRMWRRSRGELAALAPAGHAQACRVDSRDGRLRWTAPCARALGGTGLLTGVLSGLLGVGGGFVIVPALTRHTDLDARSIAATSLAVIALATLGALFGASHYGSLDLPLALSFGGAATLALLLGRQGAKHLPASLLQASFAVVSAVVALLMLARGLGWLRA
jgi:uncharacterized protein